MRPVTERFNKAVRGSHKMTARARIVSGEPTGVDPDGVEVPIVTGNLQFDSTAAVRGTLDLTIEADWPDTHTGLITPYGNEVFVERGIDFGNGTIEWVSQGYYRIYSVEQESAPNGTVRIAARDRMSKIVDDRLLAPMQFGSGASFASVVDFLVDTVFDTGLIYFDWQADDEILGSSHIAERERYDFLKELCDAYSKDLYFDYRGYLVIATPPDPTTPVFTVDAGEQGVLLSASRALQREGVYNIVVAQGEPVGEALPVSGGAYDNNPNSPTYAFGPFGKVPRFFASSFLTTTDQCNSAARKLLGESIGLPYVVNFDMVPNAALEVLDPVLINIDGQGEVHVIDTLTLPLDTTGALTATTRQLSFV